MDRLSVLCFAGTYGLALASDLSRFAVRSAARWYLTVGLTALAWVVQQPGVTTAIPGARSVEQARANAAAAAVPPLPEAFLTGVSDLYDRHLRSSIHPRW